MACALPTHAKLIPTKTPASGSRTDLAASASDTGSSAAAPTPTMTCASSQRSRNLCQPGGLPLVPWKNHCQKRGKSTFVFGCSPSDFAILGAELCQGRPPLVDGFNVSFGDGCRVTPKAPSNGRLPCL